MVGALSSHRGFGLVGGPENSYRGRWPSATLFLMSLLLVALFFSRGFRLVVGALDLWLGLWTCSRGFGLVAGTENSYGRRWPSATVF